MTLCVGVQDKIRIILNKVQQIDTQQLLRVYGALMWSLGEVSSTLNPQPSTLNPQPSTLNPQPSTLDPIPSTLMRSLYKVSSRCWSLLFVMQA
jgi:hypothetical protein